jgi:hypothetical protein
LQIFFDLNNYFEVKELFVTHSEIVKHPPFVSGDCDISNNVVSRRFSDDLHEFATLCLQKESVIRPTASQLLTHPIFKSIKRGIFLPDLLKPAMPLSSRVAVNTGIYFLKSLEFTVGKVFLDEVTNLDVAQQFADMEVYSCEWDF